MITVAAILRGETVSPLASVQLWMSYLSLITHSIKEVNPEYLSVAY